MKKKSMRMGEGVGRKRMGKREYFFIFFFSSRKSDRRFSLELKIKLIYATRATRGRQNLGVSSNPMR